MNNTLHTPGPWKIAAFDGPHEYASIEAGNGIAELVRICDIPNWPCAIEEMRANANLIASAPDLLQAVEDFLLLATLHDWEGAAIDNAREALRKAKGEA